MTGTEHTLDYSNLSDRPPGRFVTLASRLLPGVRAVQEQIEPYARSWERENQAALADNRPIWVSLGDSMTIGVGASAFDNGWVGQLARSLTASDGGRYRVVNLASSGARVEDVLRRQLPALRGLMEQGVRPELVTLLIGSNDLIRKQFRTGLPERFRELLAALPPGTVVATLPQPREAARAANADLQRAAAAGGVRIAEMRSPHTASWRGRLAADHFHPNDSGYAGLAAVFADAIGR